MQQEHFEEKQTRRNTPDTALVKAVREAAYPLAGTARDYDALMDLVGEARFVLLGEASHGTHDFYHERAQITERLITEKGFTAVAVEADWPDAYRVNRYVRGAMGAWPRTNSSTPSRTPVWSRTPKHTIARCS